MFDLSRLTDLVGSCGQQAQEMLPGQAAGLLENLGLEPSTLAGMSGEEIMGVLQERGLDIAQLDPQLLTDLVGQLGADNPLAGLVSEGVNRFMR